MADLCDKYIECAEQMIKYTEGFVSRDELYSVTYFELIIQTTENGFTANTQNTPFWLDMSGLAILLGLVRQQFHGCFKNVYEAYEYFEM